MSRMLAVSSDTGYFAMTPEWVLDTASANAVKLYGLLRRYADKDTGVTTVSRRVLATRMQFSQARTVDGPIQELVQLGAMDVIARYSDRGDQEANEYRLRSVIPAHVARAEVAEKVWMWVVVDPDEAPEEHPSAVERTTPSAQERTPGSARTRTGGSASQRTGGGALEQHGGSALQGTGVVPENAHKRESPQPESPEPEKPLVIADAITAPAATAGTALAAPDRDAAPSRPSPPPGVVPASRLPSGKRRPANGDAARFGDLWRAYPRHDDKRRAERAWLTAIRRETPDEIIAGAHRYADDPNREPAFTKQLATWLNADAWGNDPLPARRTAPTRESSLDRRDRQIQDTLAALAAEEHAHQPNRMELTS